MEVKIILIEGYSTGFILKNVVSIETRNDLFRKIFSIMYKNENGKTEVKEISCDDVDHIEVVSQIS